MKLIFDTATEASMVAIMEGDAILYHVDLPRGLRNSHLLVSKIEEGFLKTDLVPEDLQMIVVGVGPGSYTGVRVGVMVAKTLSLAWKKPLVGVPTLKGFWPQSPGPFAAMLDAKSGGVYCLHGVLKDSGASYFTNSERMSIEDGMRVLQKTNRLVSCDAAHLSSRFSGDFVCEDASLNPRAFASEANRLFSFSQYSLEGECEILYLNS